MKFIYIADGLAHFTDSLQVPGNSSNQVFNSDDDCIVIYTDGYVIYGPKNSFTIVVPCNWMLPATSDS